MGVPRLFQWICREYPEAVKHFDDGTYVQTVDHLHIDSNAILHHCAQKVYNYGGAKRLLYPYKNLTDEQKRQKIYEFFFQRILELKKMVVPTETLFIAIDGTAPAGKMVQQRQRRFVSSLSSSETNFDSNCLSPGTEFMEGLKKFVIYKILTTDFGSLKVIFSGPDVPGEGEHKIVEWVRENPSGSHCMWGPDGDLIMLTLASPGRFFLLREDQYSIQKMFLIDIQNVKENLRMNINDFVLLGFFVGNDFLPKLQMFYYLEDGMDLMLKVYSEINCELTKNGKIDYKNFKKFVDEIQKRERDYLESQIDATVNDPKFQNKTLLNCVTVVKGNETVTKHFSYEKYQEEYHKKVGGNQEKMVRDYMEGIDWVFKYYTNGCPSFRWFYKYHYAPLMVDFQKYFKSYRFIYQSTEPHSQFQQLLSILPKRSRQLLPEELRFLLDKNSPIEKYYPETFEIDYEGKYQTYQGIALLPFVDYDHLKKVYSENVKPHRRNRLGDILHFTEQQKSVTYKTKYGRVTTNVLCKKIKPII